MMDIDERIVGLLRELYEGLLEIEVEVEYLEADEERPFPSVLVFAPPDDEGRERVILLAFIPDEGALEEVDLLQLYMPLPVSPEEAAPRLAQTNADAVLGHTGIMESGEVYWRHVWPLPRGMPIIPQVLFEVMSFFLFSAELGMMTLAGKHPD
jgi:hypothetical protein